MRLHATLVLIAGLVISGCGGGSGPTSPSATPTAPVATTPTTPPTPAPSTNPWTGVVIFGFANANLASTIQTLEFNLDGVLDRRYQLQPATLTHNHIFTMQLAPGRHTVSVRIAAQTQSPTTYITTVSGSLFRNQGQTQESFIVQCADQRQSLATGGEISCSFTLQ